MITLDDASFLARRMHEGQVDKAGNPYYLHVFAVRDALAPHGPAAQMAGVLHDIVEDTSTTLTDLRMVGVPEEVVLAIGAVTRRPGESYMGLIRRAAADPLGRLVKLADNRHNSDEARLALLPADQAGRLRERYRKAREVLEQPAGP